MGAEGELRESEAKGIAPTRMPGQLSTVEPEATAAELNMFQAETKFVVNQ